MNLCDGAETHLALETNAFMTGDESVKRWELIKAFRAGDECFYARDQLVENVRSLYTLNFIGTVHVHVHAIAFSVGLNGIQVDQVSREDNSRAGTPDKWR